MRNTILILLFLLISFAFVQVANAQPNVQIPQSLDSLSTKVMKLMEFYDTYEDGSPESLKKAKYNDAVDEISGGTASEKAKEDVYKIIDAYIKGDKALEKDSEQNDTNDQDFDEAIKNTDEAKAAISYLNQQKGMFQQMSYSEFETYVEKENPFASKTDIKQAYNKMHQNDGKQVSIATDNEKMTEAQKQMWAIDILQNPESYEKFSKACKILKPKLSESEIRKAWNAYINK